MTVSYRVEEIVNPLYPYSKNLGFSNLSICLEKDREDEGIEMSEAESWNSNVKIVNAVARKFVGFFKYELNQPFLDLERVGGITEATLHYRGSSKVIDLRSAWVSAPWPWLFGKDSFGCVAFSKDKQDDINNYLCNDTNVPLWTDIMSAAQQRAFEEDYAAAILFLCISCEMAVKSTLKEDVEISKCVLYKIVEDGSMITLDDFVNALPKRAGITSFKDFDGNAYNALKDLIKYRNKIAHGIDVVSKEKISAEKFGKLWSSAKRLNEWLASYKECKSNPDTHV